MATPEPADAHSLVSAARDLIHVDDPRTAGLWPRAAALLARQAIEATLEDLWQLSAPGLEEASARCQLLCLVHLLGDPDLAGRVHATWEGLSRSSHIQIYELAPTATEVEGWLETAWEFADRVAAIDARAMAHRTPPLPPPGEADR